jgi:hypothetical protein
MNKSQTILKKIFLFCLANADYPKQVIGKAIRNVQYTLNASKDFSSQYRPNLGKLYLLLT